MSSKTGEEHLVAHTLWERCAIPAILYAVESMVLTNSVVNKLDNI